MSAYYTRYCAEHGDYDADVDGDQECEKCFAEGKTAPQIAAARIATLEAALDTVNQVGAAKVAELEAALSDAKRDAERLFLAAVILRGDFATHPPEFQQKWIHLPEFRASIDAYALAAKGGK